MTCSAAFWSLSAFMAEGVMFCQAQHERGIVKMNNIYNWEQLYLLKQSAENMFSIRIPSYLPQC